MVLCIEIGSDVPPVVESQVIPVSKILFSDKIFQDRIINIVYSGRQ